MPISTQSGNLMSVASNFLKKKKRRSMNPVMPGSMLTPDSPNPRGSMSRIQIQKPMSGTQELPSTASSKYRRGK
jgi:hypothetical protein